VADLIQFRFPPAALKKLGLRAVQFINARTERGIGVNDAGNEVPFEDYSERTFARPIGGITKKAQGLLGNRLKMFTTSRGKLWALIEGGYKALKAAMFPGDSSVNLYATGNYLAGRTVTKVDASTGEVTIGFATAYANEIALYHNVLGAGKRKVKRQDMGLTKSERQALAEMAIANIQIVV
jgi:hypothetical protein